MEKFTQMADEGVFTSLERVSKLATACVKRMEGYFRYGHED